MAPVRLDAKAVSVAGARAATAPVANVGVRPGRKPGATGLPAASGVPVESRARDLKEANAPAHAGTNGANGAKPRHRCRR